MDSDRAFGTLIGSSASLSSGFHPQSNGQSERANHDLETALHCLVSANPTTWSQQLVLTSLPRLIDGQSVYTVRHLLKVRPRDRGFQYLVDWEGYDRSRSAGSPLGTSWTQASSLISNAGTPVNHLCAQVGRQVSPLEGGLLSHPDLLHLSLCLSPPPLQVSPIFPIISSVFIPVFSVCLLTVCFVCLAYQHVLPLLLVPVFPVFTILLALTLSLPAVLYLVTPHWITDLSLPLTCRFACPLF